MVGLEHDWPPLLAKRAATRGREFVALECLQEVNFLIAIFRSCLSLERRYLESLQTIKYLMTISISREQSICSSILTGGATMATGCAGWAGTLRNEKSFGQQHFVQLISTVIN